MKLGYKFAMIGLAVLGGLVIFVIAGTTYIQDSMDENQSFHTSKEPVEKVLEEKREVILQDNKASNQVKRDNEENQDGSQNVKVKKDMIVVHIAGAVIDGDKVVELEVGSRLRDAVKEAGGLREDANTDTVNLAKVLTDGSKEYIPYISDTPQKIQKIKSSINTEKTSDGLININTASKIELTSLKNVGNSTAQKIIDYRNKNGAFEDIKDIMKVSGIGEKTFEGFKDRIVVN